MERLSWLCRWVRSHIGRCFPDVETYRLLKRLEEKQRDIKYLEFQLARVRAEKFDLEQRSLELRDIIACALNEPVDRLRSTVRFHVREAESGSCWEVVTDHCCLGGCDMNIYGLPSERDALLFARLLDAVGYRPPHNIACPSCYAVYMRDCV